MDTQSRSFSYIRGPLSAALKMDPALTKEGEQLKGQAMKSRNGTAPSSIQQSLAEAGADHLKPIERLHLETRAMLRGHLSKIYAMQWANDSRCLVSASQDGKMIVWDAHKAFKLFLVPLESAWVMSCSYAPSGGLIACGGLDNACSVYSLRNVEGTARLTRLLANGHDAFVACCRFVDDQRILTASGDKSIQLWDIDRRESMAKCVGHTGGVMSVCVSPTDGGSTFISGGCDASAKLWDLRSGGTNKCVRTFPGHRDDINDVKFFPNGQAFASGSDDGTSRLFDLGSGKSIALYELPASDANNPAEVTKYKDLNPQMLEILDAGSRIFHRLR